ncbi:MAG TPA: OFA family MFS transporter [Anaerolineae bacterium]|nr:OFA family MFS transporter [Anaerolineae bacterium]HQI87391.1 OFA family MFS transporter [Anaerolineae bacterium]
MAKSQPKILDRRLVVVGALLVQLCLGAIYAWSVFTPELQKAPFNFTSTQTQIIFSVSLATFAVVMVLAGRWQAQSGPRIVALTGGAVLGAGYILAGLFGQSFWAQVIFIGLVGGAGIGLAYVCPIAVGVKWYPDKKGLITGLGVAGFGFGALIWVYLAGNWGHLIASLGVLKVFFIYGIIFAVAVIAGSTWMVNPPEGYAPKGWKPPQPASKGKGKGKGKETVKVDYMPNEMLRTLSFYGIWAMFIFSSMAGLMTIGNIKLFGIDALKARAGLTAEAASAVAGTAMAVFYSLANGIGRIVWGTVADKIGYKLSLVIMCAAQGVVMLLFFLLGGTPALLYLAAMLIGFNFGGNFALFPLATSDMFGAKNLGRNYGWVFTAYGVGGILGPILAGTLRDASLKSGAGLQGWLTVFIICGVACLAAAVIGWFVKPPQAAKASA